MFWLLIIVILLTFALVMATHRFLQTRRRSDLLVMIGFATLIAIIAIPWLMIFLGVGTNIE
ncbi:hypothetical protein [Lacticaseibacillus porcinae]|uniref:hypothetical protein n=1 Tax=Lacticaseibacillus porcinae TaxID=1123687 RepID=UPI000F78DDC7|nr:hypothetical protein [Lacticaseibacillus porcinae]